MLLGNNKNKFGNHLDLESKATGKPSSSSKGRGSFHFAAAECSLSYFRYLLKHGNRIQRRKAKKMLRRKVA
jgi:hypothetical protein